MIDDLYLIKASEHNALKILRLLIDNRKNNFDINLKKGGITLLYAAVQKNAYNSAKFLLERGANPNIKSNRMAVNPLHSTAEKNSVDLANY